MTSSTSSDPIPSVAEPVVEEEMSSASSSSSISEDGSANLQPESVNKLKRPKIGSRKSSGSLIIPRDSPNIEARDEEYAEDDARTMSPRRTSEEIERLGRDARRTLIEQARVLQASLMEICDRVESIKSEHSKLEGENRFLQNYIGELMQTTKITATGASKGKGKARAIR